uniref:Putative major capsid protein n=1 Tax=viral metagenome TaxID=1070528 RepID=A0A6M3K5S9_9ZZZZ
MTAALTSTYLTLADWAQRQKPTGGVDQVIEVLAASNPILADANVMEGNLPTGHRSTQRTSQPTGTWRLLNYGVASEKSTTEQVTDLCGILEAYSTLDVDEASLNGDEAAFRASEDNAFVSGLSSTAATALFYGNQNDNPEQMHGLSPRYNNTSGTYASQIITGGSADTDNTSIWIVTWGPNTCSLIYPKGSKAGLTTEDLGKQLVRDSSNRTYQAYVTKFQWKLGLTLRDYRYVIRICNIDSSLLTSDAATGADLLDKMLDGYYARPTVDLGKMAKTFIYCNKRVAKFLHKQAQNKSNVNLTLDAPAGKPVVSFLDAPIRVCDNITVAEDLVGA